MLLRPTYTDQKFDSHLLDKSQTRRVLGCMSLRPTPPRRETLKICMDARKTRRGLDENGHIYRKPGGDWIQYEYSYRILAGDRIPYVSGNHILGKDGIRVTTCRLYLFYIGRQMARTGVNVSRQESRATRGMRSAVCVRQSFTLRLPSLVHSPSPSYC